MVVVKRKAYQSNTSSSEESEGGSSVGNGGAGEGRGSRGLGAGGSDRGSGSARWVGSGAVSVLGGGNGHDGGEDDGELHFDVWWSCVWKDEVVVVIRVRVVRRSKRECRLCVD
jgi:hypothetical protein